MSNKVYLTRNVDITNKHLSVSEKFELVKRFLSVPEDERLSKRQYAMSHGIAEQTFKDWLNHYLRSESLDVITMQEKSGSRCFFDDISIETILKNINDYQKEPNSKNTKKRITELMNEELDNTKRRRGFFVGPIEVSSRYVNDFMKKYNIPQRKSQSKTQSSIIIESEPKNTHSHNLSIKETFDENIPNELNGNLI